MRRMHHDCRLVHGDLSEYNMLYHEGQLYFIDVSQVSPSSISLPVSRPHPSMLLIDSTSTTHHSHTISRWNMIILMPWTFCEKIAKTSPTSSRKRYRHTLLDKRYYCSCDIADADVYVCVVYRESISLVREELLILSWMPILFPLSKWRQNWKGWSNWRLMVVMMR